MIEMARVVAVHPEANKVDLVFLQTGRREAAVSVLSSAAGTDVGFADLPVPKVQDTEKPFEGGPTGERDIYAAVSRANGIPFVVGFAYPQTSQMFHKEPGRMVYRHGSGFVATVDANGNFSIRHPSGTKVSIGEPVPDFEGQEWNVPDTGKQPSISFSVSNKANGAVAGFTVAPDGSVSFQVAGAMTFITSTLNINGDVHVTGDVVASGISLVNHVHPDPQGGKTSKPE